MTADYFPEDNAGTFPGCCAISVISGFGDHTRVSNKKLTDEQWYCSFAQYEHKCTRAGDWPGDKYEYYDTYYYEGLPPIFAFAHASHQKGPFSPKKLAEWLVSVEEVVTVGEEVEVRKGVTVTPYYWAPSKKFEKQLKKIVESVSEINKKNAQEKLDKRIGKDVK